MDKKTEKLYSDITKVTTAPYEEKLAEANSKLEAISKALPDYRIMAGWNMGAKIFVRKVQSIIDADKVKEHP